MFDFLLTQTARARRDARNWLEAADKVLNFRRDQLSENERSDLAVRIQELRLRLKKREGASQLKLSIEALAPVLERCGGSVYPKSSFADNIEFFLVAAIVILGIRAYFVQPFKIPTNSMWPSYYGMTHELFRSEKERPGAAETVFRQLTLLASRKEVVAPTAGKLRIPFDPETGRAMFSVVRGRFLFLVPEDQREYTLFVGSERVTLRVPLDFDFDWVIEDYLFGQRLDGRNPVELLKPKGRAALERVEVLHANGVRSRHNLWMLSSERTFQPGEVALSFDIITGDQLFVDRFSYHFFKPSPGEGFVFRTDNIRGLAKPDGTPDRRYYIKRLVGLPGDTLEIRDFRLLRNGAPITGADAFEKNATRTERYVGYRNSHRLSPGETVTVPENSFLALGDNSASSLDGRMWGFVPEADVIGRPLFIYYPFTKHWGPAR